ncbi:hypothetical protein POX_c04252 [Penicillium oxalicum]|uniref:hypothetical protein n=1 Tax=Penicillium oxalicum TaxID=69781 RepID=UPI0020B6E41F|nr:hypothetical protein POX_c04252 [Penicillium oxalicum]KAI2791394.1 hypothetical protein POX_c04252 [Penicillium oxalicum]
MRKTGEILSSDGIPSGLITLEDSLRVSATSPFTTLDDEKTHQTLAGPEALSIPANLKREPALWPAVFTLSWAILLAQYAGSNQVELDVDIIDSTINNPVQHPIIIPTGPDNSIQNLLSTVRSTLQRAKSPDARLPGEPNIDRQAFRRGTVSLVMARAQTEKQILTSDLGDKEVLRVMVIPGARGGRHFIHIHHSTGIPAELGSRILHQFVHVARQIADCPTIDSAQNLDMLTMDDEVTLSRWATTSFPPISQCFHHLVASHAQTQPSAPAVSAWDGELSYGELDALSSQVASQLIQGRLLKGAIVPLLFEKSMWMVVSILAVHKAGGACVGLCASHPDSYIKSILEQTGATRILASSEQARRLKSLGYTSWAVPAICEEPVEPVNGDTQSQVTIASDAHELAYVIFTSGSTGKPKGVLLTHEAISTSAYYHGLAVNVQPTSRILQFSSYAFDMSVIETWYALARGGCLCIPSENQRLWHLPAFIAEHRANWAFFTPTLLRGYQPTDLCSLDTIVLGGENVTQDLVRRWDSHVRLFDLWGPAESAGAAGCEIVRNQWISGTFGRGAGCTLWIVQPADVDQLAPIGSVGEVVIEGHIVAMGYLNDPIRTAQAFIPPPMWRRQFLHPVQGRFYKTGDLGQYNVDGTVRYISRKDTVVKINGQRVDLDAVESAIRALLPTRQIAVDAVVLQGRNDRKDPTLLAFLETPLGADWGEAVGLGSFPRIDDPAACSAESDWLGRQLRQSLPRFMVPLFFIPLVELPCGATGKVDKKRLRACLTGVSHTALSAWLYESPVLSSSSSPDYPTPVESPLDPEFPDLGSNRLLVNTVKAVLGIAPDAADPDVHRSFRQLGGDSISAIQLVRALADQGITVQLDGLMSADWSLAEVVDAVHAASPALVAFPKPFGLLPSGMSDALVNSWVESAAQQCQVAPSEIEDMYPCTPLQEGLMSYTSGVASDAYIDHFIFHLPPKISLQRVKAAWVQAVQQLGILRTRIVHSPSSHTYQAVVHEKVVPWVEHPTVSSLLSPDHTVGMGFGTRLIQLHCVTEESEKAVPEKDDGRVVAVTIHHAIYDGWTLALLVRLVEQAYNGGKDQQPLPFSVFVQHIQSPCTNELNPGEDSRVRAATFWREEMADLQPCTYPEYPSQDYTPRAMASVRRMIPQVRSSLSSDASSSYPSSPTLRLRLSWALLLSLYSGSDDVVFGTVVDGRRANLRGIENIAGPTLSTLPIRVRLQPDLVVDEALKNMHESMMRMVQFEQFGLRHIARAGPDAAQATRFRTMLVVQADPDARDSPILGRSEVRLASMQGFSGYGLVLICHPESEGCAAELLVDEKLVSLVQAERMLDQLAHLMHELGPQNGSRQLQDINLLCSADRAQLSIWQGGLPPSNAQCIHDFIGQAVATTPQKLAICAWDGDLTYAELDGLSTAVARDLRAQDSHLPPGEGVICLLFPRSRWAPVAMLAAMKAGRPFVLLDREQPLERHLQICKKVGPIRILAGEETRVQAQGLVDSVYVVGQDGVHSNFMSRYDAPTGHVAGSGCRGPTSADIAYIVFTSGSTGEPKGVMIEHGQFSSAAKAQQHHLRINSESRVLHLSSYSFDSFAVEILTALCSNASVCIPSDAQSRHEIAAAVQQFAATWMVITPSMLRLLDPHEVPTLRTLVAVGESLPPSQAANWASRVHLICGYGPTECCTGASAQPISSPSDLEDKLTVDVRNIGTGMGARLWLSHPNDVNRLVPVGAVGEILIQGPIVGRGYLHSPEKTSTVFLETTAWLPSIGTATDHRFYRTGDLGRYNDDGSCTFLGRKTEQVKLNGQRLDLPTVEDCLHHAFGSHCTVIAAVIRPKNPESHPVLVAMAHLGENSATEEPSSPAFHNSPSHPFRPRHSAAFTQTAIRAQAALHQSLPPVMVPSVFLELPAVPLLASGKANRPALQRAAASLTSHKLAMMGQLGLEANEEQLRGPDEENVAWKLSVWVAELSSKNSAQSDNRVIGRNVTPSRHGLDSIDMVALARRIAREYGLTIPTTVLFRSTTTVRTIAEMVRAPDFQLQPLSAPWQDYKRLLKVLSQFPVLDRTVSSPFCLSSRHCRRVFLTGCTGFLGTRILQQLVADPEVLSVTVLVRGSNEQSALSRLVQAARQAQWWRDEYFRVIHVWVGDLCLPQLGLSDGQWRILCGRATCPSGSGVESGFNTIIHNGAKVHWVRDYEALQPSNVQSTFELLRAVATNRNITRFLYVSALRTGEEHLLAPMTPGDEMARTLLAKEEAGYSQTKLVSELLVQRLMMGTVTDGVANLDDVIWRTVSAARAIGGYNADEEDSWLYIAPVDWVAAAVVQSALLPCIALENTTDGLDVKRQSQLQHPIQPISILDGLRVRDFWHAVNQAFVETLRPMSARDWMVGMRESIQSAGEQHPLWPVVEFLEATAGSVGSESRDGHPSLPLSNYAAHSIMQQTVARNVRYLSSVGYWESGADGSALVMENVFRRG